MKKFISWVVVVGVIFSMVTVFSLVGCKTTAEVETAEDETAEVETAEVETAEVETAEVETADASETTAEVGKGLDGTGLTLVFVPKLVHPWYEPAIEGAQKAADESGATMVWSAPSNADIAEQNQLLESLLVKGMDGLAVNTLSATAQNEVIREIVDKGVTVIMFGNDAPTSDRISFLGTGNFVEKGIMQGMKMAELIGGKGQVAILTGEIGVSAFDDMIAGNKLAFSEYPDIEVVAVEADNDDFNKALSNAETLMLKYPDLAGFVGTNQTSLPAAARVVNDAGKAGQIKIVGIDLPVETAQWIREGVIQETYIQNPYLMGYWGVYFLISAIQGNSIPASVDTGAIWINMDNIDEYAPPEEG